MEASWVLVLLGGGLTCVVEAVQHRRLPKVQFTKVDGLQFAAHRVAGVLQALQSHALRVTLLARLPVHHIGHRHRPAFARLPGGQQASAVHRAACGGGAEPPAADHRVMPETPGCRDPGDAAAAAGAAAASPTATAAGGALTAEAVYAGTSVKARHR